jgi:peptide subunit release factor 1 (eRF1)
VKITLAIPEGKSVVGFLDEELAAAKNIKSDATRKQVLRGLSRIKSARIDGHWQKRTVFLYDGDTDTLKEQEYYGNDFIYRCEREFVDLPAQPKSKYLLVAMDANECTIGLLNGKRIEVLWQETSYIPGKVNGGGQSKVRYQRNRELALKAWYKKIAAKLQSIVMG